MKAILPSRHLTTYLFLSLIVFLLSCKKDSGFTVNYSGEPFYKAVNFEEVWSVDVDSALSYDELFSPILKAVENNILLGYDFKSSWFAMDMETGEFLWVRDDVHDLIHISNTDVLELEDRYVYYSPSFSLSRHKETGEILNVHRFSLSFAMEGTGLAAEQYGDKLLVLTGDGHGSGTFRLYEFDPVSIEATLLVDVEDVSNPTGSLEDIYLDKARDVVYFFAILSPRNDDRVTLAQVDLRTRTSTLTQLDDIEGLSITDVRRRSILAGDFIYLPITIPYVTRVYDLSTQNIVNTFNGLATHRHYRENIVRFSTNIELINGESAKVDWKDNYFSLFSTASNAADFLDENRRLLIFYLSGHLYYFDMDNGDLLIKHPFAEGSDSDFIYTNRIAVDYEKDMIFMNGYYRDTREGIIRAFRSPIPLQ